MAQYEYKVVPAPRKGRKAKGHKSNEARFSYVLQEVMNEHGAEGWEYLRAETLPCDERSGLTGSQTVYRDVLVFRRERTAAQAPVNLPAIEHMPEDNPNPPAAPDPEFQTARDPAADGLAAPVPAPPVRHVIDEETALDSEDDSERETPPRRA